MCTSAGLYLKRHPPFLVYADVLTECMNQQLALEKQLREREEETAELQSRVESYRDQNKTLHDEKEVLRKQIEALAPGGDESRQSALNYV